MKKLLLLVLAAAGLSFASARAQTITATVGSGADTSYVVIEAAAFGGPLIFAFQYDYDPANPFDTSTMLSLIDDALPELSLTYINYGTVEEPNLFLDAVTWQGLTLTNTPAPEFSPYWVQWVSGGRAGFPEAEPIPSGTWMYASGVSAPYRLVEPGSWDGFVYNDGFSPPAVDPVPEPAAGVLLLTATGLLVFSRRRRTINP
jgi:PEP-CTERM putative exosortase interaction domain